jgi:trimethylamine corrinoid protein
MSKEAILDAARRSMLEADEDMAVQALRDSEAAGIEPAELLSSGFSAGMKELGDQFGRGEVFLPELIFAAEVMKVVTSDIESKMDPSEKETKAIMVIGTVAGDVHDIGKGIVTSMIKTNGVEIYDLGREVPAEAFIEKVKEVNADFLGSSALLTTTMTEQKKIEELMVEAGLKGKVMTMVGGAPVTKRWAEKIGADVYCEDATDAVKYVLEYIESKK